MGDNAFERYGERVKVPHLVIQEVAKRVENILGEDSSSKIVHDRLRKKAEAFDEVIIPTDS